MGLWHGSGICAFVARACGHIALVGETYADAREVMVDGPSGILSVSRASRPRYETTRRRLLWDNGAVASLYSSEDPDGLRGPQFDAAWCDELAKWKTRKPRGTCCSLDSDWEIFRVRS